MHLYISLDRRKLNLVGETNQKLSEAVGIDTR